MNAQSLLDQLLRSGQSMLRDMGGGSQGAAPTRSGGGGGGIPDFAKGALSGGALGMLLGSKRMGKFAGKAATYGGLAALGVLAYRAYSDWQKSQGQAPKEEPRTLDRLPEPEVEEHSRAVLKALLAAARSDGHIDARERELIDDEVERIQGDAEMRRWVDAELAGPVDPAAVAGAARTPEMAAEMYLASLLMVDEESFMERAYLDELARHLKLEPALKSRLEAQVRAS